MFVLKLEERVIAFSWN